MRAIRTITHREEGNMWRRKPGFLPAVLPGDLELQLLDFRRAGRGYAFQKRLGSARDHACRLLSSHRRHHLLWLGKLRHLGAHAMASRPTLGEGMSRCPR